MIVTPYVDVYCMQALKNTKTVLKAQTNNNLLKTKRMLNIKM